MQGRCGWERHYVTISHDVTRRVRIATVYLLLLVHRSSILAGVRLNSLTETSEKKLFITSVQMTVQVAYIDIAHARSARGVSISVLHWHQRTTPLPPF